MKDRSLDMRWGRVLSNYNPNKAEVLAGAGVVHKDRRYSSPANWSRSTAFLPGECRAVPPRPLNPRDPSRGERGLNAAIPFVRACLQRVQPVFYLGGISMSYALQLCCTDHA